MSITTATRKLYKLIRRDRVTDIDECGVAVVVATSAEMAVLIHPRTGRLYNTEPCKCCGLTDPSNGGWRDGGWAKNPNDVEALYLGVASDTLDCPFVIASTAVAHL